MQHPLGPPIPEAHTPEAGACARQELLPSPPSQLAGVRRRMCARDDRTTRRRLAEFPCELNAAPLPFDDFMLRAFFSLANRPPPAGLAAALELARDAVPRRDAASGSGDTHTIDLTGGDDADAADAEDVEVVHADVADETIEVVNERSFDDVLRERAAQSGVIALDDDDEVDDDGARGAEQHGAASDSEDDEVECLGSVTARGPAASDSDAASDGDAARECASPRRSPSPESDGLLRSPSPFSSSASSSDDDGDAHRPRSPWSSHSDGATQERSPLELAELGPNWDWRSVLEL